MRPGRLLPLLLAAASAISAQSTKFGGKYEELTPLQQDLVQRWAVEFRSIFHRPADPAALYNRLPLSTRTTFEAVTHALAHSKLTSGSGKPYGSALDLVDLVERVAGKVDGARGDSQFRMYVYLKPGAVDKLYNSKEFKRDRDNTVFHIGYPINFRQLGGVPSVQFSVTQTGARADIDVDYRPSEGLKALTSGHLTSANSDVRAGNNHQRHVGRWEGFADWWRELMAGLMTGPELVEVADFTPESHADLEKKASGPLPELIEAYLTTWLIKQEPLGILSSVSIKAYPCVAEFSDGSKPDSKMALLRILNQLQQVNQRIGKVTRLEDVVTAASYPLPESEPVKHSHSDLFTIQRIHQDVGWALDCRVRYGMHLVESIPRPPHELASTYVAAFRLKQPGGPLLLVQTWQKESGSWKLVSFEVNPKDSGSPADLLARATHPAGSKAADAGLQAAVDGFLTTWLIDRRLDTAAGTFLPESYACDADSGTAKLTSTDANVRRFLTEIVQQSSKEKTLTRVVSASQAAHPGLKPLLHPDDAAYFLAEASPQLMSMHACRPAGAAAAGNSAKGVLTAFHLSRSKQESAGVINLYWKNVDGAWRIASFGVSDD